jgi:short-subunit dehydrogenase
VGVDPEKLHSKKMLPEEVVDASLKWLGKKVACIPHMRDNILIVLANALTRRILYRVMQSKGERIKKFWENM